MIKLLKDMVQAVSLSLSHRSVGVVYLLELLMYYIFQCHIFSSISSLCKQLSILQTYIDGRGTYTVYSGPTVPCIFQRIQSMSNVLMSVIWII